MPRHIDGRIGRQRMKRLTVALLHLIEERSGLMPHQLEGKFEMGLKGVDDYETGQEWKRYSAEPTEDPGDKKNQALSLEKLAYVVRVAATLGYLNPKTDFGQLGLVGLIGGGIQVKPESSAGLTPRIKMEREAAKLFRKGKERLLKGLMPLPPGGANGGKPRKPRSAAEATENYMAWIEELDGLGGEIFENRSDLYERDVWLASETGADVERRPLNDDDYQWLHPEERPFNPERPYPWAVDRLHVRFSFGYVGEPWIPKLPDTYCPHPVPKPPAIDVATMTESEIEQFFQSLKDALSESAARHQTRQRGADEVRC